MSEHCRAEQRDRVDGAAQDLDLMDAAVCVLTVPPETDPTDRWTVAACIRTDGGLPADASLALGIHGLRIRHLSVRDGMAHVVATA